jgi:hypothetical protein
MNAFQVASTKRSLTQIIHLVCMVPLLRLLVLFSRRSGHHPLRLCHTRLASLSNSFSDLLPSSAAINNTILKNSLPSSWMVCTKILIVFLINPTWRNRTGRVEVLWSSYNWRINLGKGISDEMTALSWIYSRVNIKAHSFAPNARRYVSWHFPRYHQNISLQVSITFDPFMYLTLPLPVKKKWRHTIRYVPWDSERPHLQVRLFLAFQYSSNNSVDSD